MKVYVGVSITWIQPCIHTGSYFAETPRIMYSTMCEVRLCCYRKLQPLTRSFHSKHSQWHLKHSDTCNSLSYQQFSYLIWNPVLFKYFILLWLCIVTTPLYPIQFWDLSFPRYREHNKIFYRLFQLAFSDTQSEVLMLLNKAQWKSFVGSAHMKVP